MSNIDLPNFLTSLLKRYRHLLTVQNIGLAVAMLIAFGWLWGSVNTLQRNYRYQRQVDVNENNIKLMKLQNQNYQYQQAYLKSTEFQELSARQSLGLAQPGEKLVLLPSSEHITDKVSVQETTIVTAEKSNITKWVDFFFTAR